MTAHWSVSLFINRILIGLNNTHIDQIVSNHVDYIMGIVKICLGQSWGFLKRGPAVLSAKQQRQWNSWNINVIALQCFAYIQKYPGNNETDCPSHKKKLHAEILLIKTRKDYFGSKTLCISIVIELMHHSKLLRSAAYLRALCKIFMIIRLFELMLRMTETLRNWGMSYKHSPIKV